ncbi:T9SS type A sorting domain-containing protein [Chryseobacterium suipulveris]|uniref:T9SS type A sorting domain-containing protein n=1 Tax=Chryseobacterium suipulveris TaxID=2929800 RepID=A0ABY4BKR4_9FLAO|nr:right-handed parallel beta-helix repeat-containing protein [Chryseobacterium suipulveris]UOE39786.1 T9SS type A sorting domain-containing protein [Chryseobacterium suipulveris]
MKKLSLLFLSVFSTFIFAQFTTPGNGTTYTLSTLSAAAPTVLVNNGTFYQMTANITIAANDTLLMDEDTTLKIDGGLVLTVAGTYNTTATNLLITATNPAVVFKGFRLESTANVTFKNTTFEYGGGIQSLTGNFLMDNCIVQFNKSGQSTGAAINFSTGNPVVKNSQFIENDLPAVASGANQTVALEFSNNYLFQNTKLNSNRPQINMGPSGAGGLSKILNNTIIGNRANDKVGGISVSGLLGTTNNVLIDGNTVTDNRYGITVTGNNASGTISNNILTNNNVETVPNNGGSGINLNGSGSFKIENNQIRGHLWGITLVNNKVADLGGGSLGSVGNNVFKDNGNSGVIYALYNNTPNAVSATNNCWREGELSTDAMVEEVITHQVDIATLGLVTFSPYLCAVPLATSNAAVAQNSIYPNPSNGTFTFDAEKSGNIVVTDMTGKIVYSGIVNKGKNRVSVKATSGTYVLLYQSEGKKSSSKLIIK